MLFGGSNCVLISIFGANDMLETRLAPFLDQRSELEQNKFLAVWSLNIAYFPGPVILLTSQM